MSELSCWLSNKKLFPNESMTLSCTVELIEIIYISIIMCNVNFATSKPIKFTKISFKVYPYLSIPTDHDQSFIIATRYSEEELRFMMIIPHIIKLELLWSSSKNTLTPFKSSFAFGNYTPSTRLRICVSTWSNGFLLPFNHFLIY